MHFCNFIFTQDIFVSFKTSTLNFKKSLFEYALQVQEGKLLPYILLMFVVEIGVIVASVYAFIFIYNIEGYLVLDHETYDNMAKLVSDWLVSKDWLCQVQIQRGIRVTIELTKNFEVLLSVTLQNKAFLTATLTISLRHALLELNRKLILLLINITENFEKTLSVKISFVINQ